MFQSPEFPQGEEAFYKYLREKINFNWTHYFEDGTLNSKIVLRFIINEDGAVSDIYVYKSIHPKIDAQMIEIIRNLPKFKPALDKDMCPVKTVMILPIQLN